MPTPANTDLAERHSALARILDAHTNIDNALTAIADYCDDPAAISSPSLIADLDTLLDDTMPDITLAAERLDDLNTDLARRFAELTDLCPSHFCDPDNCADEH